MEGAARPVFPAGFLEFDARADELDDVRAGGQVVDEALGDAAGHDGGFCGLAAFSVFRKCSQTRFSSKNRNHHERAHHERRNRSTDDQRQPFTRKTALRSAFGFDLARDGDADERDEDQRAGGGYAPAAQTINRLTWF
jgi:hypothetical protein